MVCYSVPTGVLALSLLFGRRFCSSRLHLQWFNLLFAGGSVFGFVDHLWNGELFLIGPNIASDLALGFVIGGVLFAAWVVLVALDRTHYFSSSES